jgi:hypothetical protein
MAKVGIKPAPSTGGGSGTAAIPQYDTDPVSPAAEDAWVLRVPRSTAESEGTPIGLLLTITKDISPSNLYKYLFSYQTQEGTLKRVEVTQELNVITPVAEFNSDKTLGTDDVSALVNATGGVVTITLPSAVGNEGKEYRIKKVDASGNAVVISAQVGETIDGSLTQSLPAQWDSMYVMSSGSNWFIIE